MSCMIKLNQKQNESIKSILQHGHLLEKIFLWCEVLIISICDAESHFNDGTNERYHLLIHHKKLEQLKEIEDEKLLLLKSPQNTKDSIKYCSH